MISGSAPLLIGRPTLERLQAKIDFGGGVLHFLDTKAKMITNAAGQVLIDILDFPKKNKNTCRLTRHIQPPVPEVSKGLDNLPRDRTPCKHDNNRNPRISQSKTKVTLKKKECKCLLAQFNKSQKTRGSKVLVAELFSPPRVAHAAQR